VYDLAFHDFRPFIRRDARSRSQQLILFSLDPPDHGCLQDMREKIQQVDNAC
jgi:hypothetical protein